MELVIAAQTASMRKKSVLQDIQFQARQAGRRDSVAQLQEPLAGAEAQLSEIASRVKELLSLTLPATATVETIQQFEEAYGKIIAGLRMEMVAREAELKQVDKIVEIVKDDIAKAQR